MKRRRPLLSLGSRRILSEKGIFLLSVGGVIGVDDLSPTLWSGMSGYLCLRKKKKKESFF